MSSVQERLIGTRLDSRARTRARLYFLAKQLLLIPGFRAFKTLGKQIYMLTEPAGRIHIRPEPLQLPTPRRKSLTILSNNLNHDWPRHRRLVERLEVFARLVESVKADIVLLQEVARLPELWADRWLSERLGMAYVYSRANGHEQTIGFEEGLVVLSRFPIDNPRVRQLERGSNPLVRRLALGVDIHTPWGRLPSFSVHLALGAGQNSYQLTHLHRWVSEISGLQTALVGGDFNAAESTSRIAKLQTAWVDTFRQLHHKLDGSTHELRWPWGGLLRRTRLDYIFLKPGKSPWKVLETRHISAPESPHSDHLAVLTRLAPSAD